MSLRQVSRILGIFLIGFSLALLLPFCVSIYFKFYAQDDPRSHIENPLAFFLSMALGILIGLCFFFIGKKPEKHFYSREVIFLAILMWIVSAFIGSFPFIFSKTLERPYDAYFESMSALTTTGATTMYPKSYDSQGKEQIIKLELHPFALGAYYFYGTIAPVKDQKGKVVATGVNAVARSVILWRSFMQWIGAMGVVFLFVACFPLFGIGLKNIFELNMSGPFVKGIAPRIKETISRLWKIYLFLTLLLFVLILLSVPNMSVLEAACLTFTTISTGGMDIKTGGVGSFNSVFLEWILIVFMMVGSINFSLYYHIAKGNLQRLRNPEFLLFLCGTLIFAFILSFILYGAVFQNLAGTNVVIGFTEALRYGIFHAVSSITTTGYSIANYVLWPWTAQIMMFVLTFVGGMVGSTTGGLKVLRHFVLFKTAFFRLYLFFKPDSVRTLKIDEMEMNQNFIQDILVLFWTVIIVGVISVFVFVSDGINPHSSMGIVSSMLTNSGLAFHVGGYVDSVVFLSPFLKVFSSFLMLLGRLEYFILLILFIPSFWRSA